MQLHVISRIRVTVTHPIFPTSVGLQWLNYFSFEKYSFSLNGSHVSKGKLISKRLLVDLNLLLLRGPFPLH